jgi:hypothetical protein
MFKVHRSQGRDCGGTRKVCVYVCLLGSDSDVTEMIQGYLKEIEELRAKLLESEAMCQQLRKASSRSPARIPLSPHAAMTGEVQANLLLMLFLMLV